MRRCFFHPIDASRFASLTLLSIMIGLGAIAGLAGSATQVFAGQAGQFEISLGGSYSHSTYTDTDYEWERRYGASVGFYLTDLTELEVSWQDSLDRTNITGYEDTTFHDDTYGVTLSQTLAGKNSWLQPYVKAGIGQLNREASGSYAVGAPPPEILDQVTGIIGGGLKIYLSKSFGLRVEATSYLTDFNVATWRNNINATYGISIYF
jgi:hypothetical protein